MRIFLLITFLIFISFVRARTIEKFTTKAKHVYASWSTCDNCTCYHFNIGVFDTKSNDPETPLPMPFYLYYSRDSYNSCTLIYDSDIFYNTDPNIDLDILRSNRYAELTTPNMTSSRSGNIISLNFIFDARKTESHSCNCKEIDIQGIETIKINSKTNYKSANLNGNITINGITQTIPNDAFAEIFSGGTKTITITHN